MNLLAIDIGNTTTTFGIFKAEKLAGSLRISTNSSKADIKRSLRNLFRRAKTKNQCIDKIALCSVVPVKTKYIKRVVKDLLHKPIAVIGKDIRIPIKNLYKDPRQVGGDRLVNAFAGLKLYGPGIIIVDFGTAITFDLVSKKGAYLGGLILPGIDLIFDALYQHTELLPKVSIKRPSKLLGQDTVSCINNGVVFGIAGACDALIERLQGRFPGFKVIATGGSINLIKLFSRKLKILHPSLTLEGISLIYRRRYASRRL